MYTFYSCLFVQIFSLQTVSEIDTFICSHYRLQTIYASAGMAGPQFIEPYASPKLPAVTSRGPSASKSLRHEPVIHISDPHDIALKVLCILYLV